MPGIWIYTTDASDMVYIPYGEQAPKTTGGGPIIGRTTRPRRKTLTEWTGREEYQTKVSFFMSDWETRSGVEIERKMRALTRMQGQEPGDPEAPKLIIKGDPINSLDQSRRLEGTNHLWYLEEIDEDDEVHRNAAGNRIETKGFLTFTEAVEDEGLDRLKKAREKPKDDKYAIKAGDTLKKIANKKKVKGGWHALAKKNKIRDPNSIKVGQVLRLP